MRLTTDQRIERAIKDRTMVSVAANGKVLPRLTREGWTIERVDGLVVQMAPPKFPWERVYLHLANVVLAEIWNSRRASNDPIVVGIQDAMLLVAGRNKTA